MAFKMDGEMVLPATRERVWAGLNDPEVLRQSIKGCQKLEALGGNAFAAEVKMKIGPVASVFNGQIQLSELDPPNGYRITGQGDGGAAGFAKGGAIVTLGEAAEGTLLRYEVNAEIGGRLAQLGGRLINGVAKKQADMFFEAFAAQFAASEEPEHQPASPSGLVSPENNANTPVAAGTLSAVPVAHQIAAPSPPWAWFFALAVSGGGGFLLGRTGADALWVLVMIMVALVSAGAGYGAALPRERK